MSLIDETPKGYVHFEEEETPETNDLSNNQKLSSRVVDIEGDHSISDCDKVYEVTYASAF